MNRTVNLFLLLILGSSFIFPAAAIKYAQAEGTTVITSQPNAKSFKCIDPTGKKLLCILVVTHVKPPKNTLTCKDPDNHKFKCTYIIINKKYTNNIFHKIVFLYVYVTPKDRKLLYENKTKVVPIFVTKVVVKIIHEHEPSGNVRVVVIREQENNYRPTVVVINCFAPCFQEEYSRALIQNTIFSSPVFITNFNEITNIVNNVNTINSVNVIKNNIINNAYLNNVNTDNMNIFNPPPPPAYSPTTLFSLPPDTPIYKGGTTNPNIASPAITNQTQVLLMRITPHLHKIIQLYHPFHHLQVIKIQTTLQVMYLARLRITPHLHKIIQLYHLLHHLQVIKIQTTLQVMYLASLRIMRHRHQAHLQINK